MFGDEQKAKPKSGFVGHWEAKMKGLPKGT